MTRAVAAAATATGVVLAATVTTAGRAAANDEKIVVCDPKTKVCSTVVVRPAAPGGGGGRPSFAQAADSRDGDGPESAARSPSLRDLCYVEPANPQPPASDPVWAGHEPGTGVAYHRTCPLTKDGTGVTSLIWVAQGESAPVSVTPAQLAWRARDSVRLPKPAIRRSPSPAYGEDGVPFTWVNLWTWYWTSAATWRPRSARAAAGPVWAEVTVTPTQLIFHPGDGGAPVSCDGRGRPWEPADGDAAPSNGGCGYRYRDVTSGGPLTATVSIRWRVSWTGSGGAAGTLPDMTTRARSQLEVQQIQAVIAAGPRR